MGKRLVRYGAAMMLLMYGFAKINGSQFTILDSELDKPMGQVSGFWLTWYYFGYSAVYGNFLALVQITGALMLTFRRTVLLGACTLAPVLGNIILIDVLYGVDLSATIVAIILLAVMLWIISGQWQELKAVFLRPANGVADARWRAWNRWGVRIAMVTVAVGATYWLANYNNRDPTPIDGTWDVVRVEPKNLTAQSPKTIYFEYNRANMAVLKFADGTRETRRFEVNSGGGLQLSESWLTKGDSIFEGKFRREGQDLRMDGTFHGLGHVVFQLSRRSVR